jgi:hypothetical protein
MDQINRAVLIEPNPLAADHLRDRRPPPPYLTVRIALIEQLRCYPPDGLSVEPALRPLAAPFTRPAWQLIPRQLVILPLEAGPGGQVGHIVLITEGQVEAADFVHRNRIEVVFEGPFSGQAGSAFRPPVDDLGRLLASFRRRNAGSSSDAIRAAQARRSPPPIGSMTSRPARSSSPQVGQGGVVGVRDAADTVEEGHVVMPLDDDEQLDAGLKPGAEVIQEIVGEHGLLRDGWRSQPAGKRWPSGD